MFFKKYSDRKLFISSIFAASIILSLVLAPQGIADHSAPQIVAAATTIKGFYADPAYPMAINCLTGSQIAAKHNADIAFRKRAVKERACPFNKVLIMGGLEADPI